MRANRAARLEVRAGVRFCGAFFSVFGFLAAEVVVLPLAALVEGADAAGTVVDCAARVQATNNEQSAIAAERRLTVKPKNGEGRQRILPLYAELDAYRGGRESPA